VRDKVKEQFADLGEHSLKNIARTIRVYAIEGGGGDSPQTHFFPGTERREAPRLSIVVLPFANFGGDPEQEYFVDGVTESLTTDLSRINGSFVIARNTAFTFKSKPFDVRQIGRELNVRYVLEGSIQRGANRMRVNAQLVDAATGNHIWAERFDKPTADLFALQDEIVARLANTLQTQLVTAEARRAERAASPDSMDLYFQGMAWSNRGFTPDNLTKAVDLYLALGSLPALQRELKGRGVVTRTRTLSSGRIIGGGPLTNGPLAYVLRNRLYLGEINHRDKSYPAEHVPILDNALFDSVQAKLDENKRDRRLKNEPSQALLLGKLFDDRGNRMTPSFAIKKGVRYRYYVSCVLAQGRKDEAGSLSRIAASEIETIVLGATTALSDRVQSSTINLDSPLDENKQSALASDGDRFARLVERVIAGRQSVEIRLAEQAVIAGALSNTITIQWSPEPFRRKREVLQPADGAGATRSIRIEARAKLLGAIAKGRLWLNEIVGDPRTTAVTIAEREGLPERSVRSILSLAFLAPDIVKAAVNGTLPRGFGVSRLIDLPAGWREQRRALGLAAPASR
jgi:TolB-like protein